MLAIPDELISNFEAYVLYGSDKLDLLYRVKQFVGDCAKLVVDEALKNEVSRVCSASVRTAVFDSIHKLLDAIRSSPLDTYLIVELRPPIDRVSAILMLPVNERNRKAASKVLRGGYRW